MESTLQEKAEGTDRPRRNATPAELILLRQASLCVGPLPPNYTTMADNLWEAFNMGRAYERLEVQKAAHDYPEETDGSRVARQTREACNDMTPEERKLAIERGLEAVGQAALQARSSFRPKAKSEPPKDMKREWETNAAARDGLELLPVAVRDWEPCAWDGEFPVFMRESGNSFVVKFQGTDTGRVVATDGKKRHLDDRPVGGWFACTAKEHWTPVWPKYLAADARELGSWFWKHARRIDVWNVPGQATLVWLTDNFRDAGIVAKAPTFQDAVHALRQQVEAAEKEGGAK